MTGTVATALGWGDVALIDHLTMVLVPGALDAGLGDLACFRSSAAS